MRICPNCGGITDECLCETCRTPTQQERCISMLEAERDVLKAEVDQLQKIVHNWDEVITDRDDEIARLREALRKYGEHFEQCDAIACTCGLDAAVKQQKEGGRV